MWWILLYYYKGAKMKMRIVAITSIFFLSCPVIAQDPNKITSVFNQQWLKALVSIEICKDPNKPEPYGTGFLVNTPNKHIALITAKHLVFADQGKGRLVPNLAYRLNDKKERSSLILDRDATIFTKSGWIKSGKFDVACRLIVRKDTTDFITIPYSAFLPVKQLQAGAPLFIIGFPMGIRSEEYTVPIVRRAIVARPDPNNIIVDGFVFPGNSGGPVVYEPTVRLGKGFKTPILQGDWMVGMVLSYIPYAEAAFSSQTQRPRIIFEENSGLCNVLPADQILDLLESSDFVKVDKLLK
jgi:hypothetical protein